MGFLDGASMFLSHVTSEGGTALMQMRVCTQMRSPANFSEMSGMHNDLQC